MDPITLEVVLNRVREIVATMEHLLFHSGYSTVLRESYDGSAGLCDRDGYTVMASGAPYHLFPYAYSTRGILERYPLPEMRDGDSFILTDPYAGGNLHVPDLVIATPIFVDDEVLGFCVSIAHKTDLGGLVPGSSGAGAREIFHDGLLLPGVRYWTKDGVVPEVEAIVKRNSRAPETVAGDIRAQVGCTRVGGQRIRELCAEYGTESILYAFAEVQRLAEGRVRRELASWPDGTSTAESWVDHDGVDLDKPVHLQVTLTKQADELTVDFSGCNDQVKGPINLRPQHAETATLLALLSYLDPTIPINEGARRPIAFINPEGRVTNARWPAPVNSYYAFTHVLYCTIQKALVEFNPRRAVGTGGFGGGAIAFGHRQPRPTRSGIQYEISVSSLGATPEHDGTHTVQPMSHASPNTPIEIIETEFPIRVTRHEWLPDSGGAGRYRGGPGYIKEYQVLGDALLTLRMGHNFEYSGWGVLGGQAPPTAHAFFNHGGPDERALRPLETLEMRPGDRLEMFIPGGGGYGNPFEREPERVLEDVLNHYVSLEAAEQVYGVAIDRQTLSIDLERTRLLRNRG
jgi:N-methylhydantoinase B